MIDIQRSEWPADMQRAARFPQMGTMDLVVDNLVDRLEGFARENPIGFGLCALAVGFVLGWRLKPW